MATKQSSAWPVNENGEVVAQAGTGSTNVVANQSQDQISVDSVTGKFAIVGLAAQSVPIEITGSRALTAADNGAMLYSASASAITLTVPSGLPIGFGVAVAQNSTGQVTITAGAGVTVNSVSSYTKTSGQHAVIGISQTTPNNYKFVGSGAA